MGALVDLFDAIMDMGEIYEKHGIKGCLLSVFAIVIVIAIVVVLALWLGS